MTGAGLRGNREAAGRHGFHFSFGEIQSLARKKPSPKLLQEAWVAVQAFVDDIAAQEVPFTPEIGRMAFQASTTYGKVIGHAADLDFGDCFAYACAKALKVFAFL